MTIGRAIVGGVAWTISARWAIRAVGLISTIILARILAPQEFGVVAMATLAAGLIEVFTETGLVLYLIRKQDPDRAYFDTVWTLRAIIGIAFGAVIFFTASLAAGFFNEPLVEPVMQVLALKPVLSGLENTGMIWYRKNMQFGKDFLFMLLQKLAAFATTIPLAFILANHWALVAGIMVGSVAGLILSFTMHNYRPRFDLSRTREVWGFSLWMLAHHVLTFLNERVDEFLVGRFKNTQAMGFYNVAADIGAAPIREILAPTARALFPAYAKIAHDKAMLARVFEKVFGAVALASLALGPGTALIATDLVSVLLGPGWIPMVPTLIYLALASVVMGLSQPHFSMLPNLGHERLVTYLSITRFLLLTAFVSAAAMFYDLEEIAAARALALAMTFVVTTIVCVPAAGVGWMVYLRGAWRPTIACAVMTGVVILLQESFIGSGVLRLFSSIVVGGITYTVVIFLLWVAAGKPDSIENDLIEALKRVASSNPSIKSSNGK